MKRKLLFILSFVFICFAGISLSACGKKAEEKQPEPISFDVNIADRYNYSNNTITMTYGEQIDLNSLCNVVVTMDNGETVSASLKQNDGVGYEITCSPEINTPIANAGTYTISVKYDIFEPFVFNLVVNKAEIDLSNVVWSYTEPFTYNGEEQQVTLLNLPSFVTANYSNNKATNVGSYTASATLSTDNNHIIGNIDSLTWTINKAETTITNVSNISKVYDGTPVNIPTFNITTDGQFCVLYKQKNSPDSELTSIPPTNKGEYTFVIRAEEGENYLANTFTYDFTISAKQIDMSNVAWNYTDAFVYDGEEKSVSLINLPDGITAQYINNTGCFAGEYNTSVTFIFDEENCVIINNNIEPLTWIINKANAVITSWPENLNIRYESYLNTTTITGGNANIDGIFACANSVSDNIFVGTNYNIGDKIKCKICFIPDNFNNYNISENNEVEVTVIKAIAEPYYKVNEIQMPNVATGTTTLALRQYFPATTANLDIWKKYSGVWSFTNYNELILEGTHSYSITWTPTEPNFVEPITAQIEITGITAREITPEDNLYDLPTNLSLKYGMTLSNISLISYGNKNGYWRWENTTTKINAIGAKNYVATFVPYDTLHYLETNINIVVTGLKGDIQKTEDPTISSPLYIGRNRGSVTITGGKVKDAFNSVVSGTWSFTTDIVTAQMPIIFTPTDSEKYNTLETTFTSSNIKYVTKLEQKTFAKLFNGTGSTNTYNPKAYVIYNGENTDNILGNFIATYNNGTKFIITSADLQRASYGSYYTVVYTASCQISRSSTAAIKKENCIYVTTYDELKEASENKTSTAPYIVVASNIYMQDNITQTKARTLITLPHCSLNLQDKTYTFYDKSGTIYNGGEIIGYSGSLVNVKEIVNGGNIDVFSINKANTYTTSYTNNLINLYGATISADSMYWNFKYGTLYNAGTIDINEYRGTGFNGAYNFESGIITIADAKKQSGSSSYSSNDLYLYNLYNYGTIECDATISGANYYSAATASITGNLTFAPISNSLYYLQVSSTSAFNNANNIINTYFATLNQSASIPRGNIYVASGSNITLDADLSSIAYITVEKNATLNLGGHTISLACSKPSTHENYARIENLGTVTNGTIFYNVNGVGSIQTEADCIKGTGIYTNIVKENKSEDDVFVTTLDELKTALENYGSANVSANIVVNANITLDDNIAITYPCRITVASGCVLDGTGFSLTLNSLDDTHTNCASIINNGTLILNEVIAIHNAIYTYDQNNYINTQNAELTTIENISIPQNVAYITTQSQLETAIANNDTCDMIKVVAQVTITKNITIPANQTVDVTPAGNTTGSILISSNYTLTFENIDKNNYAKLISTNDSYANNVLSRMTINYGNTGAKIILAMEANSMLKITDGASSNAPLTEVYIYVSNNSEFETAVTNACSSNYSYTTATIIVDTNITLENDVTFNYPFSNMIRTSKIVVKSGATLNLNNHSITLKYDKNYSKSAKIEVEENATLCGGTVYVKGSTTISQNTMITGLGTIDITYGYVS